MPAKGRPQWQAIRTRRRRAYEEEEKRGFLKVTLLALVMALLAVAALGLLDERLPSLPPVLVGRSRRANFLTASPRRTNKQALGNG